MDYQPQGHLGMDWATRGQITYTPKRNRMNTLANTLLILAGAALLAAIWIISWQFLATGILLAFTGAAIKGNQNKPRTPRETAGNWNGEASRIHPRKIDDR